MIGVLLILLIFLACFSGAEAAILAANRLRAKHRAELGEKGAQALVALHARKHDFLPVLLAIETLLTVVITTLGTAYAQTLVPGTQSLFISAVILTVLVLTVGEIVPKTIATHTPDRFASAAAPTLLFLTRILSKLLHPFTWLLGYTLNAVGHESSHAIPTELELKYLISLSREHGILQQDEEELLQNIFDFTDAKVGDVMVPRTQMESLETGATIKEVLDAFVRTKHSRFPVQGKNLDDVVGVIDVGEVLLWLAQGHVGSELTLFVKPTVFVPESKRIGKLLQEMRKEHFNFAVVIDEYGGTAGLVTLTDLIEEIVGTIESKSHPPGIRPIDEKTLIVPASMELDALEDRIGVPLPRDGVNTIGGFVFALFGRVPEEGEQVRHQNVKFTVTQKDGYRIQQVMITKE